MHVKRLAMTCSVVPDGYVVAVFQEDHPGWSRHPTEPVFNDFVECQDRAMQINANNGLTDREALAIVSKSLDLLAEAKAAAMALHADAKASG